MSTQPKFVAEWMVLSATLTFLCAYAMLMLLPAFGLTHDLWFLLLALPPAAVVGGIVGCTSKDDRGREAALGFLIAVTIATIIALAIQPEDGGNFQIIAPLLSSAQIVIGTMLTYLSAGLGRQRRYRALRGWRLE